MADAPPLSLLCRSSLPISHPGSPGRRVSPAWPDWARSPASQLLPSALQALGLGPISCQGRGPLPGLARSPQRWHPGPGAHNGPYPLSPPSQPLPDRTPAHSRSPTRGRGGLRGAPPRPPAVPPWGSGTISRAGRGSAPPPRPPPRLTALLRVRLFPGKFLPAPQAGEGFPEQRLGHAGAWAGPSARPGSGHAAPRPPRPPRPTRASPPAPRSA